MRLCGNLTCYCTSPFQPLGLQSCCGHGGRKHDLNVNFSQPCPCRAQSSTHLPSATPGKTEPSESQACKIQTARHSRPVSSLPSRADGTGSREVRQRALAGFPISTSYDSAGCPRSDIKIRLGKWAWQDEKEKVLPALPGRACPRCLGNASCSPRQGAGESNTRKKQSL